MLFLFGKKKMSDEDRIAQVQKDQQAELEAQSADSQKKDAGMGEGKLAIEITKINAQLEGQVEVRKATSERFSRIGEQIGELRGMIVDTQKTIGKIEVAATKAQDLVESVQPEKLMIDVRKMDGKVEALRAQIEAGETRNKDIMEEIKKVRHQMNFYKGVEQVSSMMAEMKTDLLEMKKMQGMIERHSDKVETIFLDVSKRFSEFDKFNDVVKDMQKTFDKISGDFDKFRVKLEEKADKKQFTKITDSFNDFEKHTGNVLKLLDERSKSFRDQLEKDFKHIQKQVEKKYDVKLERSVPEEKPSEAKESILPVPSEKEPEAPVAPDKKG
ncbi:MAG: hypothetical protein ABIA93_04205 [Candidatus Woesearchaeota archaeon]